MGGSRFRCMKKCLEHHKWIPFTQSLMRTITAFGRRSRGDRQLVMVFSCNSGKHRSVAAAELVARFWRTDGGALHVKLCFSGTADARFCGGVESTCKSASEVGGQGAGEERKKGRARGAA